jgi:hypothetical protein
MGYYKNLVLAENKRNKQVAKSVKANKKILAFIICLVVSAILWIIVSLNKNYTSSITFNIKIEGIKNISVKALIYGNGFDILKEKLFVKPILIKRTKIQSIKSEVFIQKYHEFDEHLKYSDFEPASITIK